MSTWLVMALTFLVLRVLWLLFNDAADLIGYGRCLCSKGAVHPRCPLHGWER